MKKFKFKQMTILVFVVVFSLYSCKAQLQDSTSKQIKIEKGNKEFDKDTLYLIPQNPENLPINSKNRKDTLIIGIPTPSEVFNPIFAISVSDADVNDVIWEPMLEIDKNGDISDGVVSIENIYYDDKTYFFKVREGMKWEDGRDITSKDFEFTFKVLMDKTYPGSFERDNFDVLGWEKYRDGLSDNIEGFKIIDDTNFSVKFNSINAKTNYYFERIKPLAFHVYGLDYVQGNAKELEKFNKKPFGNGAYKFVEYIEGEEVRLVKNEHHYGEIANIKNLILRITNDTNQLALLGNGDIDIVRKGILTNQESIELLNNMGFIGSTITTYLGYGYIAINHKQEIMKDKNVRKALAYGLDRKTIVDICFGDFGQVIDIPQNKSSWAYPKNENFVKYDYNLQKAKDLLEESGWKVGDDGIREKDGKKLILKFLASTPNEVNDILIPIMIDNYKKIGIKIVVEQMESKTVIQKQKEAQQGKFSYDLAFLFTPFANSDPDCSSRFATNGTANRTSYSNEKVDKLLKAGLEEFDKEKRKKIYEELYYELSDDLPYIFLFEKMKMDIYPSKVKGMDNVSLYRSPHKDLEKIYFED